MLILRYAYLQLQLSYFTTALNTLVKRNPLHEDISFLTVKIRETSMQLEHMEAGGH